MSGVRQRERHAQFHMRKPLKAFSQSDPLTPPFVFFFLPLSLCFPAGASTINSKLFSFPLFTLCCFHYANAKPAAALTFSFTFFFFPLKMELRMLTCLSSSWHL